MDHDFPKDPKEVESRLMLGGRSVPQTIEPEKILSRDEQHELDRKDAWDRAVAAGVIYVPKPEPPPPPAPPPPTIFDSKPVFDMPTFTEDYGNHFDEAIDIYTKLLCKSLAYISAAQILETHLNQLDQFRGMTAELDLIRRIVRTDVIRGLCDKLDLDPEIFYSRSSEKPRKHRTKLPTTTPPSLSNSDLDAILSGVGEKLKVAGVGRPSAVVHGEAVGQDDNPKNDNPKRTKRKRRIGF